MNRIYRTVFNRSLGQYQVASELTINRMGKPGATTTASTTPFPKGLSLALQAISLATAISLANSVWAAPGEGGTSYLAFAGNGGSSGHGGDAYYLDSGGADSNGNGGNGASSLGGIGAIGGTGGASGSAPGFSGASGANGADTTINLSGGGGGGGGAGLFASSGTHMIVSATGGHGGNGGNAPNSLGGGGGGGGNGITLSNGGTLTNLGSIVGGNGGNGGAGVIDVYAGAGGGGGHGVSGANLTIVNMGTISAGLGGLAGNPAVENGENGAAVQFTSGDNSLTLQAGSVINGVVWLMDNTRAFIIAEDAGLTLDDGVLLGSSAELTMQADQSLSSGAINGGGSLTKSGNAILTLNGNSSYTGPTTIVAGSLQAGNSGALSSASAVTINSGATLNINSFNQSIGSLAGGGTVSLGSATLTTGGDNTSTTFAGTITGTGGLTKHGTGTLTLSGSNNFSGATLVSAGTLLAGSANTLFSTSSVTVNSGATLDLNGFNQSIGALVGAGTVNLGSATLTTGANNTSSTFSGAINGTGGLSKTGSGTLILIGANAYTGLTTINAGILQIGNGGTSGNLTDNVLNNASLVFNRSDAVVYGGAISGSGTLTKTGTGKLVLDGINTYTGTTTVNVGSLIIGGSAGSSASLSSDVNVASGALLGGHGSISGDVDLASGATLAPGNSIGTLTINGNATFDAGSTLEIEANPDGSSDRLIVNGNLDLGGATLNILAGAGTWSPATRYSIVASSNPIVGTFGPVTSDLAFLTPTLDYSLGNEVQLLLMRNDISFASVGRTFNQRSVASALESAPLGTLAVAVAGMSAEQAQHTFDSLSGELHASSRGALFDDSRHVREAITERLRAAQSGLSGDVLHRDADSGLTFWLKSYGGWSDKDGSDNVADFDRDSRGTLIGVDLPLNPTWRLGMALGYGSSDLDVGARASSADVDSTSLAAYLGGQWDALSLRLGVAHSWNSVDSKRDVRLGALNETLKADYDADTTQVFGELGYALRFGELTLEPFAGLAHVRVESDGFSERGGAAALRVKQQDEHASYASLGLNAATPLGDIAGLPVALNASLAWQHAFNEPGDSSEMTLATYGSFKVKGAPIAKDSALAQLGVNLKLAPSARLALGYSGQLGDGNSDHGVRLGLDIAF